MGTRTSKSWRLQKNHQKTCFSRQHHSVWLCKNLCKWAMVLMLVREFLETNASILQNFEVHAAFLHQVLDFWKYFYWKTGLRFVKPQKWTGKQDVTLRRIVSERSKWYQSRALFKHFHMWDYSFRPFYKPKFQNTQSHLVVNNEGCI